MKRIMSLVLIAAMVAVTGCTTYVQEAGSAKFTHKKVRNAGELTAPDGSTREHEDLDESWEGPPGFTPRSAGTSGLNETHGNGTDTAGTPGGMSTQSSSGYGQPPQTSGGSWSGNYGGGVNYSSSSGRGLHFIQPSDVLRKNKGADGIVQWTTPTPPKAKRRGK